MMIKGSSILLLGLRVLPALAMICGGIDACAQPPTASPREVPAVTVSPQAVTGGTGTTSPTPGEIPTRPTVLPPIAIPAEPVAPSEPPTGYTPPVQPPVAELPTNFIEVTGGSVRTTFTPEGRPALTIGEGGVTARYRNTLTTAMRGQVDYIANVATFEGTVIFRIDNEEVHGESLTLNLRTREWVLRRASTTIEPQYARGYLEAPVFASGTTVEGVGRTSITALDSETTTCNLAIPHYILESRSITVYPERRIILRQVTAYALGHRLFTLPRLVIPLRELRQNPSLVPRFGQSAEEGFFVKTSYAYMGTSSAAGFLLLDLMSKKGIGTGVRNTYQLENGGGDVQLYRLSDRVTHQSTLTGRLNHRQQFGSVQMQLSSNLRDNYYVYAPTSKSLNNQLTLTRNVGSTNTSLTVSQGMDDVLIQTRRLNGNLVHRQLFGNKMTLGSSFAYTSFGGTGISSTARLLSQAAVSRREDKFDWTLSAQKLNDLSAESFVGGGRFAGIEKLPELALVTDSTRLGRTLPFGLPAQLKVSFGQYDELPANTNLGRAYFELNTPVTKHNLTSSWALNAGAGIRQFFYSDNTAQYSVDANATLTRKLGQTSTFNLFYRLQHPRGFTPFRFDSIARYNNLNASIDLKETERFKLNILTGYNFAQKSFPWQDVTLRLSIQPTKNLLFYTSTGYDLNRGQWRAIVNQIRIRSGDKFRFDLGTRYDAVLKKFARIRPQLDMYVGSKTRIQAVAGYNGFNNTFDYRNLMITRDLHCWEASLVYTDQTGFFKDRSLMFYLRIKAFPLFKQFGIGPYGQAQDTSVGDVY